MRAQVLVVYRDGSFGLSTRQFGPGPKTGTHARTHKKREKEKGVIVAWSEIDTLGATMRQEPDALRFGGLGGGSERSKLDCRIASDSHREALLGLASGNGV